MSPDMQYHKPNKSHNEQSVTWILTICQGRRANKKINQHSNEDAEMIKSQQLDSHSMSQTHSFLWHLISRLYVPWKLIEMIFKLIASFKAIHRWNFLKVSLPEKRFDNKHINSTYEKNTKLNGRCIFGVNPTYGVLPYSIIYLYTYYVSYHRQWFSLNH
jgi:hypothetical protein